MICSPPLRRPVLNIDGSPPFSVVGKKLMQARHQFVKRPKSNRIIPHGFTLVELLVVIGIIALLIGILLPALNKARRSASTLQCSSNMRQIALGMLSYIEAAHGHMPPCAITGDPTAFPDGWWWATELVRQRYISAPSAYINGIGPNLGIRTIFKCPEGNDVMGGAGNFPTDGPNFGWFSTPNPPTASDGLGIASWYLLPAANLSTGSEYGPSGSHSSTPFVYFQNATASSFIDPTRQRYMGQIKKSSEMVMIVEA